MNVATITEDRWKARSKYAEYMRAVKERHTSEYEALKNAYRELARGKQVIDLIATMQTAGVDHLERPRLAICRADSRICWFSFWQARYLFSPKQLGFGENRKPAGSVQVPADTFSIPPSGRRRDALRAVVPSIPPNLLPGPPLKNYYILWEAEWEQIPVDPMLLKPLGKNLYVVLATWDLTPLEQAVLRDREPGQ